MAGRSPVKTPSGTSPRVIDTEVLNHEIFSITGANSDSGHTLDSQEETILSSQCSQFSAVDTSCADTTIADRGLLLADSFSTTFQLNSSGAGSLSTVDRQSSESFAMSVSSMTASSVSTSDRQSGECVLSPPGATFDSIDLKSASGIQSEKDGIHSAKPNIFGAQSVSIGARALEERCESKKSCDPLSQHPGAKSDDLFNEPFRTRESLESQLFCLITREKTLDNVRLGLSAAIEQSVVLHDSVIEAIVPIHGYPDSVRLCDLRLLKSSLREYEVELAEIKRANSRLQDEIMFLRSTCTTNIEQIWRMVLVEAPS